MIIIGEKLNSSIPSAFAAMQEGDEAVIRLIRAQADAGAAYLDINTALFEEEELPMMKKIIALVIDNCDCGLMLDSPNPAVLCEAVKDCGDREVILNSCTTDERIDELAPVAASLGCGIVVLPIDVENGIPESAEGRLENAKAAISKLTAAGVDEEKIYIDAVCETLATCDTNAKVTLDTVRLVKENTGAKTTCGLSNVSFGLPKRAFINGAFLTLALANGLDSSIIDPASKELRKALFSASAVLGQDEYCMNYIEYIRGEIDCQ
ncbi:MAG: dihydropteroate synthase [Clostridia bacterium]|nr:dihydropteroate synthase [Clostridia bacterium]